MFSLLEILDIVIMSLALGFIFKDVFKRPSHAYDPVNYYKKKFNWDDFKFAVMVTAPAVILHEFGHKFTAMAFGATATFNAAYIFLGIGILMKLLNFGFIFFVPAYVAWSGSVTHFQSAGIAFAGPLVNLLIWVAAFFVLKKKKGLTRTESHFWVMTKKINLFLFIFNMIPIIPFDGGHVFINLFQAIF
jgi:Zn-dependent protease